MGPAGRPTGRSYQPLRLEMLQTVDDECRRQRAGRHRNEHPEDQALLQLEDCVLNVGAETDDFAARRRLIIHLVSVERGCSRRAKPNVADNIGERVSHGRAP